MQTFDSLSNNIEALQKLFPQVITEKEDENWNIIKAIDFDVFKQLFSSELVEDNDERYSLNWPWKKASILKANTPIQKTLRPVPEDSVDFDTTQNLYIEWDNFEVLKVMQESYLGKVKMIYIDPPYNTWKDFVYKDNFKKSKEDYQEDIWLEDEEWWKLFRNTDTNGRFHSDWLSMMYERLVIARDLLKDDGVIFMSIDENEYNNLRKIADETFGEENWVWDIVWKNKFGSWAMTRTLIWVHEYIIIYSKSQLSNITRTLNDLERKEYNKTKDEKFEQRWWYVTQPLAVKTFDDRPTLKYPIFYNNVEIWPNKQWVWSKDRLLKAIENNEVVFNLQKDGSYNLRSKKYLIDENWRERRWKPTTFYNDVYTQDWTKDIRNIFSDRPIFDFSKPVELIKYLISFEINDSIDKDSLIIDFFSWSATTAHAVMQLNAEDGWNRKFIMVQIPEETDENSEAYKAWYKNICEIWKERIRRAGKKILEDNKDKLAERETPLDTWFRVYKIDSSNMKNVYFHPNEIDQSKLFELESNIKEDRTPLDILTGVMIDVGLTLDLAIESKTIAWNEVFFVAGNSLVACFDEFVDFAIVDEIASIQPLKVVLRDASFRTDSDKINFETRMKKLSPETWVYVI